MVVDTLPDSLYWIIVAMFIVLGGLLAVLEQSIGSARKARLDKLLEEGDNRAQSALRIIDNPEPVLLAIRLGAVVVFLTTGWLVFSQHRLSTEPAVWQMATLAVMILCGFALAFAFAASRLAVRHAELVLMRFAWLARLLAFVFAPLVHVAAMAADAVSGWVAPRRSVPDEDEIEEEVCLLLEQGAQDGVFERAEQDMVERIFTLDDVRASALMTPRTQIMWLDLNESTATHYEIVRRSGHSRFPVARGSLDEVAGVVFAKDLLTQAFCSQELSLDEHIRTPVFVPKSMSGLRILELFKKAGTHIALVIDEYGGVLGLITINDILEHIVGDLPLADEPDEAMIVQREDGSWLVDGMLPVEELRELLTVEELPEEERENYQTAGGFITSYLERIPAVSEFFVWNGWRFEVLDMDRSRVDKILVSCVSDPAEWEDEIA